MSLEVGDFLPDQPKLSHQIELLISISRETKVKIGRFSGIQLNLLAFKFFPDKEVCLFDMFESLAEPLASALKMLFTRSMLTTFRETLRTNESLLRLSAAEMIKLIPIFSVFHPQRLSCSTFRYILLLTLSKGHR